MKKHKISNKRLTLTQIDKIISENYQLELSKDAIQRIEKCRNYLDNKIKNQQKPIYGVTTGFGSLCDKTISENDLGKLQENLMMSHACGIGDEVDTEIVRIMLLLKIQSLAYGHSGVQLTTVQRLINIFNEQICPVVYQQGSLGASGDLVPLAHLCLPLIDLGEVNYKQSHYTGKEINTLMKWEAIQLKSKEGLALLNGTQFMSAYAVYVLLKAKRLAYVADLIGSISLDAFDGRLEPFLSEIHAIRPHWGQMETANNILSFLDGSEISLQDKKHVQDPYSFRCMPQVHGATKDTINYVESIIETEINSVTDNPTIFPDEDLIISAGNFHGQPIALTLDFLAIALVELGNISERRIYQLIDAKRNLPSFLVKNPGLNSGFMIPQYVAASIVNQNKMYANPSSTDSITSSQGQEDHVSMGANAATKCYHIINNLEKIFAIELFNAAQALEFRKPLRSSTYIEDILTSYRQNIPFVENDATMYDKMQVSLAFIQSLEQIFQFE
ncbi:MAG: histidine ammonia-lyase [Bacteroidales bacterium]|jgi:histidine ammonia-lyase|nr:histidine ammonia-lyase [Bacteroidales bacterium]MDD2687317.1 histidine ammonia-lyase [Bacteroidales bacterium]MDD3330004.1 histidine ammonia-lyase [Bacteroidales bacterium]MDD3690647.1 histidine ammonia-lyase [Bacteroidales bacterium]MDD4043853.1 histidine ammonia-lyase [Bacteroidales bacterium]